MTARVIPCEGARAEKFWSLVDKLGPTPAHLPNLGPCWIWKGPTITGGYGRFGVEVATRVAWRLMFGTDVTPGLVLDHLCVNPPCVNPAHLEMVSQAVNIERGRKWRFLHRESGGTGGGIGRGA